jgi:tetratricopeptide (TPR) repeat protein
MLPSCVFASPPVLLNHEPYAALPDVCALNIRANQLYNSGDAQSALTMLKQVLGFAKDAHTSAPTPQTTLDVVVAMWTLGMTKKDVGDFSGAQAVLEQAVALAEKPPVGPAHPRLAEALRMLGLVMMKRGQFDEADVTMQRALTMQEQLLGPDHEEVSETLCFMGMSCMKQGNYRRAKGLLKRAVAIAELHVMPNNDEYPAQLSMAMGYLAEVYNDLEDYDLAQSMAERALALNEVYLGPHHPNVGAGLMIVSSCLQGQGKLIEAIPFVERALAIAESAFGPKHPDVSVALGKLSKMYLEQGDLPRAKSVLQRALAIAEQVFGPQNLNVGHCLAGLAGVAMKAGDLAQAKALNERALAIFQTQLGRTHPNTAHILQHLADLATMAGRPRRAASLTERAATAAVAATHQPCGWCGTMDVHQAKKCAQCQVEWYCNQECQRKAWKEHKKHCHKKPIK